MIHITGSLQETALLDMRAIDTKLAGHKANDA